MGRDRGRVRISSIFPIECGAWRKAWSSDPEIMTWAGIRVQCFHDYSPQAHQISRIEILLILNMQIPLGTTPYPRGGWWCARRSSHSVLKAPSDSEEVDYEAIIILCICFRMSQECMRWCLVGINASDAKHRKCVPHRPTYTKLQQRLRTAGSLWPDGW